jgi:hypothetical protein
LKKKEHEIDNQLLSVRDVLYKMLHDLQLEYYSSNYK